LVLIILSPRFLRKKKTNTFLFEKFAKYFLKKSFLILTERFYIWINISNFFDFYALFFGIKANFIA